MAGVQGHLGPGGVQGQRPAGGSRGAKPPRLKTNLGILETSLLPHGAQKL